MLKHLLIPFPSRIAEQDVDCRRILEGIVDAKPSCLEFIYQRKLDALDELKKSLLHQAFSGQL